MRLLLAPVRWLGRFSVFHSLRFRLTLLVLLGSLPALGLLLLTANQQRDDALAEGQETANRLVRLAAADQRRIFEQAQQLLATNVRLEEVRGNDAEACSELMAELLAINEEFDNIGVVTEDGTVFCSGPGGDLSGILGDPSFVEEAFETDELLIGIQEAGPFVGEPSVTFAAPVPPGAEDPRRIVFASLNLGALDTFATIANLPEGTVFSVYSEEGRLLLRSPQDPDAIGPVFDDRVVEVMVEDPNGASVEDIEDEEYIYAGEPIVVRLADGSLVTAGFVTVAVPKAATVARAADSFQDNLSRLGLAAMVAVALAWIGADLFMSRDAETRKSIIAELYRVYETGDLRRLDDIVAVDVVDRSPAPGQVQGLSGYKQLVTQFRAAFPNGRIVPDGIMVDGDMVVARVTLSGTQVGEFFGIAPNGKPVTAKGVETFRFAHGSVVEMWSLFTPLVVVKRPQDEPVALDEEPEPDRVGPLKRMAEFLRRRPTR
ncbi:MAG TPA: ester cyclase [Thermomicrobiales bacterium]|nr:ester cyclase [Thermomicrobiales bacterium]